MTGQLCDPRDSHGQYQMLPHIILNVVFTITMSQIMKFDFKIGFTIQFYTKFPFLLAKYKPT